MSPLVSFVIPVLNGERDIARCLLSIKNLKCPEKTYEIIILDNGSVDRTRQIIHELGFSYHIIEKVNVGSLRNYGAGMSRATYLAFVDSDVELTPDWLRHGLEVFKDEKVVATGCFPRVPKDATWVQRAWDTHQRGRLCKDKSRAIAWLPSMNLLVRRDVFLKVRGFNDRLETAEDVDLCYRLGQHGTILWTVDMDAIHWGEAHDLRTFWRKEVWRGTSNLKGVQVHGFRWDELPSLGYPLYTLCFLLLLGASCVVDIWCLQIKLIRLNLIFLVFPAFALAVNTIYKTRRIQDLPKLFLLYFVYGLARACSVIKAYSPWQTRKNVVGNFLS
jgi:glycosyltransferase involved in cell wall biosynthesis